MSGELVDYLSDDWIAAADELLRAVTLAPPLEGPAVTIETAVTEAPLGRSGYVIEIDGEHLSARRPADGEQPTLRLTQRYATAASVARGDLSAQAAFLAADIGLGGDVALLIAHAGLVARIGDVLAPLRARTRYAEQ